MTIGSMLCFAGGGLIGTGFARSNSYAIGLGLLVLVLGLTLKGYGL